MRKNIFMNEYKQSDLVEDQINFLQKMGELKPYIVEFDKNGVIKPKAYPADYLMGVNN